MEMAGELLEEVAAGNTGTGGRGVVLQSKEEMLQTMGRESG